ncbi:MAG: hypothetical protein IJP27_06545 [Clostridia bacterium]|nr:hypothetical protein [Clostridia bacterium]
MVCVFFGHRDAPEELKPRLRQAVVTLIKEQGVRQFYVGHQGRFDGMVQAVLKELSAEYPIEYGVVLAYLPKEGDPTIEHSVVWEGLEEVPPRYAIDRRNRWMVERCDYLIGYQRKSFGGAATFIALAMRKKKNVILI